MKKIMLVFVVFIFFSCNNGTPKTTDGTTKTMDVAEAGKSNREENVKATDENAPLINMKEDTYEFGTVKEGEKVEHKFVFSNGGKTPLIISNVSASCGCTTPEYPKNPIKPGDSGTIRVVFDSQNQVGVQHKIITVLSNAQPSRTILHLRGEVK